LYNFTLTANYINLELNSLVANNINFTFAEKINLFYNGTKILNLDYINKIVSGYDDGNKYTIIEKLILNSVNDVLVSKDGNFSIPYSTKNVKGKINNLVIKF
jgi:hypothetical protein